jgi:hypothetical protein
MSEIDVARTDGFRDDRANRSRVIRQAAGRGKPLMQTAKMLAGNYPMGLGRASGTLEDAMNSASSALRP